MYEQTEPMIIEIRHYAQTVVSKIDDITTAERSRGVPRPWDASAQLWLL